MTSRKDKEISERLGQLLDIGLVAGDPTLEQVLEAYTKAWLAQGNDGTTPGFVANFRYFKIGYLQAWREKK